MRLIEPHIHMVSRTTDDYERLAEVGYVAMTEPAFWANYDRTPQGFYDYFLQLTDVEPKRAAKYGIDHYCWICINPKEADDLAKAREVIQMIPDFLKKPRVLGVGEIGLNKNTKNELIILEEQAALALKHNQLILVHTPHLEDKRKGTQLIVDMFKRLNVPPDRVLIDHCEEHTIDIPRKAGYWCGLTVYPSTKLTPQRAVDILEQWGTERIWVNSAADWGPSDPLAVRKTVLEFLRRGHTQELADKIFYTNPCQFLAQSGKWKIG